MTIEQAEQKRIMGRFATGVTIASTRSGDQTWGMTANAVTSLSLDPPCVLLCVAREGQSHEKFRESGCFALSILSAEEEAGPNVATILVFRICDQARGALDWAPAAARSG